jgi:uncharacterized caspase-like protein
MKIFYLAILISGIIQVCAAQTIQNRSALLVGISKYSEAPLRKPEKDADALALELQKLGFKTSLKNNLSKEDFTIQANEFKTVLSKNNGVGLFFFSGYGLYVNNENYLIPTNANICQEKDFESKAVRLKSTIREIESADNELNIIILDINPDCPYQKYLDSTKTYNITAELTSRKTILIYSYLQTAKPCNCYVSGLYTREFINALKISNINITDFLKIVRRNVTHYSKGRQIPWDNAYNQKFIFSVDPNR